MTLTRISIKQGRNSAQLELPVSREQLEALRKQWRAWLKSHQRPGVEASGSEAGAARSVVGIDDMKLNGFDKLALGLAVAAKQVHYED